MPMTHATAVVTDDHVLVPASVENPVVVLFDGQYVWSFSPARDGVRTRDGRLVAWPETMRARLGGTAHVRIHDSIEADAVYFDGAVAFRGSSDPLHFRDAHGHPLAVDSAGHL